MQELILYRNINSCVSQSALKKMSSHLWYLNEELTPLSLFDDSLSVSVKEKMVEAMKNRESSIVGCKRYIVTNNQVELLSNQDVSEFASKKSVLLFKKFNLPYDFLDEDIQLWDGNDSFKECSAFFGKLKVRNDAAERGVSLLEQYNKCLTRDEEQFQYLLQVVREHRRHYASCHKKILK